jgi:hypothetical protein
MTRINGFQERKRKTDEYTFGSSKAAVNLIDILNKPEHKLIKRKVRRILGKQMQMLSELMSINDASVRLTALELFHKQFIPRVEKAKFPRIIQTHMASIECAKYREWRGLTKMANN